MKITNTKSKIEIIVPPNKEWKNYFIFTSVTFIAIPIYLFVLLKHFISLDFFDFKNIAYLILYSFPGIFLIINYSLWLLVGFEKIIFNGDEMTFIKTNGIFSTKKQMKISDLKNLKTVYKVYNSDLPFFRDSGRIKFEYNGKNLSVLRGLKDVEVKIVEEIFKKQIIEKN